MRMEERKREIKAYTKGVVRASMLSEQEIEGLKDDFRGSRVVDENGFAERTICAMPLMKEYQLS
jgi:hypothetical protein